MAEVPNSGVRFPQYVRHVSVLRSRSDCLTLICCLLPALAALQAMTPLFAATAETLPGSYPAARKSPSRLRLRLLPPATLRSARVGSGVQLSQPPYVRPGRD